MNFEVESYEIDNNVNLVQTPKKLKTKPADFSSIKESEPAPVVEEPVVEDQIRVEEPIRSIEPTVEESTYESKYSDPEPVSAIEEESTAKINIDDIIKSRVREEEPEEQDSMDTDIEFAYAGRVVEPEVSEEEIDRIKSLGDDYKGELHPRVETVAIEEEPEYDETEYVALLKTECYSPKTKKYLDNRFKEYQDIVTKIESTQNDIEEITDKYKMESEIASKLTSIKKETYGIMTWINSSDFKILKNEKTTAVNNLFKSYEDLFNENQQKFKKADEELEKTNEISAELGRKEKSARESLQRLTKKKKDIVKNNYEKVEEVISLDNNMKKQASEMTALTGIDELEDNNEEENRFDSLRRDE